MQGAERQYPDVFVVDRTIDNGKALIWMAATGAREVKFDRVCRVNKTQSEMPGNQHYVFMVRVPRNADYLYGIRTSVPVENLRIWLEGIGDETITTELVNLKEGENKGQKVKAIKFDPPIPLFHFYDVCFEYCFNSGNEIFLDFDWTTIYDEHQFLNPCLSLSHLWDDIRYERRHDNSDCITRPKIILPDDSERFLDPVAYSVQRFDAKPL